MSLHHPFDSGAACIQNFLLHQIINENRARWASSNRVPTWLHYDLIPSCEASRCRICGEELPNGVGSADELCDAHVNPPVEDAALRFLEKAALQVYEPYMKTRRACDSKVFWYSKDHNMMIKCPELRPGGLMDLSAFAPDQASRIRDCLILKSECAISTVTESDKVERYFHNETGSPVKDIFEVRFWTKHEQPLEHWVFWIQCRDSKDFIFDLTGRQFGLDWPLLMRREEYVRRYVSQPDKFQRLGWSRRQWLAMAREQS